MNAITRRWTGSVTLGLALLANSVHAAEDLNARTLCPKSGSEAQTILLIDTTDPMTPVAQERLKQLLKGFGDSDNNHYLQPGHELVVYHLTARISDMNKPLVQVCNPGNPEDRTLADNLTGGKAHARRRWRVFEARRLRAFPRIDEQVAETQSPLLESIALVTARHVPSLVPGEKRKPTRLILFSDMLQNSDLLSHYKLLPEMNSFKSLVGYAAMNSDLDGVDVWLFYVRRTGFEGIQTPKHYYWWTQAIEVFGGRLIEQTPL